jgi:ABC-2 type transport system permease protein
MNGSAQLRYLRVLLRRELRIVFRDPVTLATALVAPVIAAMIASAGLGSPPKLRATVVVAPANANLAKAGALATLASLASGAHAPLRLVVAPTVADAEADVYEGRATAALIPPAVNAPLRTPIRVISNRNVPLVGDLVTAAARTLASHLDASTTSPPLTPAATTVAVIVPKRRPLDPGEIYGPVIAVFFLFLAAGIVARGLVEERDLGTFARLRSMPISTYTIVAAKSITMVAVAAVEFAAVLFTMTLIYGARWGNLAAVAAVTIVLALAVAAVAICIASITKTYQSSAALVAFVALLFAALGGSLVPLQNLPSVMRVIAGFTPNGIGIAAIHDISANGVGLVGAARPITAILAFTAVVGGIGLVRLRKVVES